MLMSIPFSEVYIAKQSADEIIVIEPPYVLLGITLAVVGATILFFFVRATLNAQPGERYWIFPVIFSTPFLIPGLWLSTTKTTIELSKPQQVLHLQKTIFFIPFRSQNFPFSQVRDVNMGYSQQGRFLYLELDSGERVRMTGSTDRRGYGEAMDAINMFLAKSRS